MPRKRDHRPRLIAFARQMRKTPTDAERKLWSLLRRGKLHGFHFRRQVPLAGYIVDFCCLSAGLGIEADRGQHLDEQASQYDETRSVALLEKGIRIIRFSDYEILKDPDAVAATIHRELTNRLPLSSPTLTLPRSTGGGNSRRRRKCHAPVASSQWLSHLPHPPLAAIIRIAFSFAVRTLSRRFDGH